jgi:hypothetical protein
MLHVVRRISMFQPCGKNHAGGYTMSTTSHKITTHNMIIFHVPRAVLGTVHLVTQ